MGKAISQARQRLGLRQPKTSRNFGRRFFIHRQGSSVSICVHPWFQLQEYGYRLFGNFEMIDS